MITNGRKNKLLNKLKDKTYRDSFVSSGIFNGIAFQIKTIREKMPLTQTELAKLTGMKQERISVLENPNNSSVTINTLQRIASAFDVGLMIRFVPYSELVEWDINLSPESLNALCFDKDPYFQDEVKGELSLNAMPEAYSAKQNSVIYMEDYPKRHSARNSVLDTSSLSKAQSSDQPMGKPTVLSQQATQGRQ